MTSMQISEMMRQIEAAEVPPSILRELTDMRYILNEETSNFCPCDGPLDGLPEVRKLGLVHRYLREAETGKAKETLGIEGASQEKRNGLLKVAAAILSCLQDDQ